ncbi:phosphatase PAP2 family protein [Paenibacillus sp. S3N08]|uniref:Phosphatase PAP2 family protein n=2 Tax=Paenibacillus agricola TaxID=2716264 RepID=A0ABX0JI54_9BACL|nr:phosphatase PAP2 family protein [Paenibacillus agricola]
MNNEPNEGIRVLALSVSVVFSLFFCIVAFLMSNSMLIAFDMAMIAFIQGLEHPFLTSIMKAFTTMGSFRVMTIIALGAIYFLYKRLHHRMELLLFTGVIIGSSLLNILLKMLFQRERPSLHLLIQETGYSFPSGHSMSAFSLYATLAFLLWRHVPTRSGRTWLVIGGSITILFIGISRIYLGVHYPSDVVGAYFASGFWVALSIWCFLYFKA